MSRKIAMLTTLLLTILCSFASSAIAQGYLHADGQYIVNEKGEKIILRGMGLGGWMLQEGYMLQLGNLGPQQNIKNKFTDLIGKEDTQVFYDEWLKNHTRKPDIDAMARWGFNSVRLPMHFNLFTLPVDQEPVKGQNTWLEKGFELTDNLLAWCKANNMYLILDLHAAPGGQGHDNAISDRDPNKPSLWQSPENQQKMIALWKKLAERYANEPWIGGYDIINEPNWGFESVLDNNGCKEEKNEPLKKLLVELTTTIRSVDTKHMIIIEGNCWGNNYKGILPAWDTNMVLSFHKYWNKNNQDDIKTILDLRAQYNIPVWLGESGENSNAWFADAIRLVEANGVGWAFWPLKKMGFNNPLQIQPNAGYMKIVAYLNGKGARPSKENAKNALMQLAQQDIRYENNIFHIDVIDAMFRQPHSTNAVPFKKHLIAGESSSIPAVEYDMGADTYSDVDTADYHVSLGGDFAPWNYGRVFRSDGVDIEVDESANGSPAYIVNRIEKGEWLQYTLTVESAGQYQLSALVKSPSHSATASITVNNATVIEAAKIEKSATFQPQQLAAIHLDAGTNTLRIKSVEAGYQLSSLIFTVKK